MMQTELIDAATTGYRVLLIDPPWNETGGGKIKRGADRHYPLMKDAELRRLAPRIGDVAAADCLMFLWATDNFLPLALDMIRLARFRYVRALVWAKMQNGKQQIGLGQYARGAHELCLIGARGRVTIPTHARPASVFFAERTKHSRKPPEFYELAEPMRDGPRLEIFARGNRDGWHAVGNETTGGDIFDDLRRLKRPIVAPAWLHEVAK